MKTTSETYFKMFSISVWVQSSLFYEWLFFFNCSLTQDLSHRTRVQEGWFITRLVTFHFSSFWFLFLHTINPPTMWPSNTIFTVVLIGTTALLCIKGLKASILKKKDKGHQGIFTLWENYKFLLSQAFQGHQGAWWQITFVASVEYMHQARGRFHKELGKWELVLGDRKNVWLVLS